MIQKGKGEGMKWKQIAVIAYEFKAHEKEKKIMSSTTLIRYVSRMAGSEYIIRKLSLSEALYGFVLPAVLEAQ